MSRKEVFLFDRCKPKLKFLHNFWAAKSKFYESSFSSFRDRTSRYTDKTLHYAFILGMSFEEYKLNLK
jgi:hypothetical protein